MARYIDADRLLACLEEYGGGEPVAFVTMRQLKNAISFVEDTLPANVVVPPEREIEQWYHEYHVIKDELKQEKMYHRETEKLADMYCAELQTAKSEIERLEKALAAQELEYSQALQDKARECNMAIDKICLEHRAKIALLHSSHEAELAAAKREVANEIFEALWEMDLRIVKLHDAIKYTDLLKKYQNN
jgi:hypothetical protein